MHRNLKPADAVISVKHAIELVKRRLTKIDHKLCKEKLTHRTKLSIKVYHKSTGEGQKITMITEWTVRTPISFE